MAAQKESKIQRDIRLKLGQLEDLVLWRNETGAYSEACTLTWLRELLGYLEDGSTVCVTASKAMIREAVRHAQWVSYGLCKGSADLIGIIKPSGRFFALELKTETGRLTDEQALFLELVNKMGGYGGVARSVEQALAHYHRAVAGLESKL